MKIIQRPVLATILFGFVCGISFIPLSLSLNRMLFPPGALFLSLWLFSAGYALLLRHWSNNPFISILYPLAILFLAAALASSITAFFIFALAVISWIRSGICFQDRSWARLAIEIMLCMAGGALISAFTPATACAWTLGIWMFFLLQALYFAIFEAQVSGSHNHAELNLDPFEQASRRAEDILST